MGLKLDKFDQTEQGNHTGLQDRRRNHDRRMINDRRSKMEGRRDFRVNPNGHPRPLRIWLRSLVSPRLGVDRRKKYRRQGDRRRPPYNDVLTPEEITELLSL